MSFSALGPVGDYIPPYGWKHLIEGDSIIQTNYSYVVIESLEIADGATLTNDGRIAIL